ncbi:MAG: hypothetical protein KJZ80_02105 [Hyphomicrobiaceae bacterium]|nr:hypothetical protein [Hyphomicrobiaceae bacterium]
MYGWRARIGIIIPADNTVIEPELAQVFPTGVHGFGFRLPSIAHEELNKLALELAPPAMKMISLNLVAYCCAASSFFQGAAAERELVRCLEDAYELPALTAAGAMVAALRKASARRVALMSPYKASQTELLVRYLAENDIEVTGCQSLEIATLDSNLQTPEFAYRALRQLRVDNAEAVLITSTSFRTLEILSVAARDLGLPVLSSNSALASTILDRLNIAGSP